MKTFVSSLAVLLLAGFALADLRFTEKSVDSNTAVLKATESKKPRTTTVALKGNRVKFSETDDPTAKPSRETLFDVDKTTQQDLNPRSKSYSELDGAFLAARVESAKKRVADLDAKVGTFQGDRKARVEKWLFLTKKVLGQLDPAPKVELKRTGEKQKIGAFDCERVVIEEANETGAMEVVFDCWMAESGEGWATYAGMYGAYRAFSPGVLEAMKEIKGFHVKGRFTLFYLDDPGWIQATEFDNSDARVDEVKDEEFVVPADYKNTTRK
ncbi:MAG: hypothetical protein HUU15_16985 [Candidatus Brocadiae bacterium]|nr:hypothetical protein [Candidatus Brocadiia bacterium]